MTHISRTTATWIEVRDEEKNTQRMNRLQCRIGPDGIPAHRLHRWINREIGDVNTMTRFTAGIHDGLDYRLVTSKTPQKDNPQESSKLLVFKPLYLHVANRIISVKTHASFIDVSPELTYHQGAEQNLFSL